MPGYNGGYYRYNNGFIEYWFSIHQYDQACEPDGIIEIGIHGAVRTAKDYIIIGKEQPRPAGNDQEAS